MIRFGFPILMVVWSASIGMAAAATTLHATRSQDASQLARLSRHGAKVSALVVRLDHPTTLARLHPGLPLTPASVSKLYTTALALSHWGTDYRFVTQLVALQRPRGSVLHGNIWLLGAGDPALTNARLWTLAQRLRATGIRRIEGNVVIDVAKFGSVACVTVDRCRAKRISDHAYNARLSAAGVNFGVASVMVKPAFQAGKPALVALQPFPVPMLKLESHVETVGSQKPTELNAWRVTQGPENVIHVEGQIALRARPRHLYRAVSTPSKYAGQLIVAFLRQAGIKVTGSIRVSHHNPSKQYQTLARVKGEPEWQIVRSMLTYSNNYMADTLALDLACTQGSSKLTLSAAAKLLTRKARSMERGAPIMDHHHPTVILDSGSGLTPGSRASARDVVALLEAVYHKYAIFPAFIGALTVPEYTPVNMLKDPGDHLWMRRIIAKTGSMNQPRSVFALAGYLRLHGGHWAAFAVLINGAPDHPVPMERALAATRRFITKILESRHLETHR